jgi:hypothetical protein
VYDPSERSTNAQSSGSNLEINSAYTDAGISSTMRDGASSSSSTTYGKSNTSSDGFNASPGE